MNSTKRAAINMPFENMNYYYVWTKIAATIGFNARRLKITLEHIENAFNGEWHHIYTDVCWISEFSVCHSMVQWFNGSYVYISQVLKYMGT